MANGETIEIVTDFIFLGSKITEDGDCSHEIKRHLFLGRKAMTNIAYKKKQRYVFADKGPYLLLLKAGSNKVVDAAKARVPH